MLGIYVFGMGNYQRYTGSRELASPQQEAFLRKLDVSVRGILKEPMKKLDSVIHPYSPDALGYEAIDGAVIDDPKVRLASNLWGNVLHDVHSRIAFARSYLVGNNSFNEYPLEMRMNMAVNYLDSAARQPMLAEMNIGDETVVKALKEVSVVCRIAAETVRNAKSVDGHQI